MRRYAVVYEKATSNWGAYVPDLPGCITTGLTLEETKRNIREAITLHLPSGDFFKDPLPKADLITMGMILHDWNLEKKMHLIRSACDALPPGGAMIAIETLIDDARRENLFGLLTSLNMLIEFGDAFDYSGADFRK